MLAFAPYVACVLRICVEGDLEKRFEAELLVHRLAHWGAFKPALVVAGVGVVGVGGHENGADATAAVGRDYGHPVDRCMIVSKRKWVSDKNRKNPFICKWKKRNLESNKDLRVTQNHAKS